MVLEATVFCIDNSEFMRNGDYSPDRFEAQRDAVNVLANEKMNSNVENTVGVIACAGRSPEVMVSLTPDVGAVLTSMHNVKLAGNLDFVAGLQVAQLALKHRQNKNQSQRIVFFVGSPIKAETQNLVRLGKRLKKNSVAVDVINFNGEDTANIEKLESFISAVDSNNNCHLVQVPPGPHILSDIVRQELRSKEEGQAGPTEADLSQYGGIDPNLDPELALAMRLSLEEEKARQEKEKQTTEGTKESEGEKKQETAVKTEAPSEDVEMAEDEEILKAIELSKQQQPQSSKEETPTVDMGELDEDEDEETKLALQMSMQQSKETKQEKESSTDYAQVMEDPTVVNDILSSLPGVNPNDDRIQNALRDILKKKDDDKDEKKK